MNIVVLNGSPKGDDSVTSFPERQHIRGIEIVTIETDDGETQSEQVDIPKGHPLDPLSDEELEIVDFLDW